MGNENVNSSAVFCSNCGGQLEIDSSKEYTECPYCGTKYSVSDLLGDTEAVRVEKIKSQVYKEVEKGRQQIESERLRQEALKNEDEGVRKFKKGALSKLLVVFIIIDSLFTVLAFANGSIASGLVGLLGIALYILSFLFGLRIIKTKAKNLHIITTIVALILAFPFLALMNRGYSKEYQNFDWNSIKLHEYLPEPKSNSGDIITNTSESLDIDIKASESDYSEYVDACIEMGYTVDSDETGSIYAAYNEEGYKLDLMMLTDYYSISLDAPEELGDLEWPDSGLAKMLPVPKSKTGKIKEDSSGDFSALVGDTSEDDFKAYVKGCKEKGFDIDYSNGDDYYNAKCSDGYELEIRYKALKIMEISLFEPYEFEEETTVAETSKAESSKAESSKSESKAESSKKEQSSKSSDSVTPEFKKAMDKYEEFFDEYAEFMEKYANSDNPASMMKEYSEYMTKYTETMQAFSECEDEEMTEADSLYYLEVQTRINQKLANINIPEY